MRNQNVSRTGAVASRRPTHWRDVHEHAPSSSSRIWNRCFESTSRGSSFGAPGFGSRPQERGLMEAPHGCGSLIAMVMGTALESVSMRTAQVRPRCNAMLDHNLGYPSATVRQWRQTCATAGTHHRTVLQRAEYVSLPFWEGKLNEVEESW